MAHTTRCEIIEHISKKKLYFSLVYGSKIGKIDIFSILGISTMDLKY